MISSDKREAANQQSSFHRTDAHSALKMETIVQKQIVHGSAAIIFFLIFLAASGNNK